MKNRVILSAEDQKIIKSLQGDLPISPTPYQAIADELGVSEAFLLERIAFWQANGLLKRLSAVIRHQNAGFTANAMVVWRVSLPDMDRVGALCAQQDFVSHCYQREPLPGFPYTLYTMIHAKSRGECIARAETLSSITGIADYQLLFSRQEFKKSSMEYF